MQIDRYIVKANRICAWILLIFMIAYITSGYALTKGILMPTDLARLLHLNMDEYMMIPFLGHVLMSSRFTLRRHGIGPNRLVNLALLVIGIISYALVLMVR